MCVITHARPVTVIEKVTIFAVSHKEPTAGEEMLVEFLAERSKVKGIKTHQSGKPGRQFVCLSAAQSREVLLHILPFS